MLVVRAIAIYVFIRIGATALGSPAPGGPGFDNPFGIILLVTVLGAIDLRRNREWMFWHNLGYATPLLYSVFAIVASIGELLLAVFVG